MRCYYREQKVYCGEYLEVDIYPVFAAAKSRSKRNKPTSETMQKLNQRNAERKLIWLLNTNFTAADIRLDLTYDEPHRPDSPEAAQREMQNFFRRVKRLRRRLGLPELKYVAVTEAGEKNSRYHHHIVMSGDISVSELSRLWGRGYTTVKPLRFNEFGIAGIAKYLIKNPILNKRYCASHNLKQPEIRHADGRIAQRKVKDISASGTDDRNLIEKIYPGYRLADATNIINEVNGGTYLCIRMYKDTAINKKRCDSYGQLC